MRTPIDLDYVSKAIVGIASPVVGVVTSFQEQIEWHLRVASLCVGSGRRHHVAGEHGQEADEEVNDYCSLPGACENS